jgi:2-phosphosulfolactate phosphatase
LAVHLTPALARESDFASSVTVVIDVLRATTTICHALAAGAQAVHPVLEIDDAHREAQRHPAGVALLAGERGGKPIPGFQLGNSPAEFTDARCRGRIVVLTTTNGTRAILHARSSRRVLIGAFVNFSAICEELIHETGAIHLLCSGTNGHATLEDTVFAGAVVERLCRQIDVDLDDGARIAWDVFEGHGNVLATALEISRGGQNLIEIGYAADLTLAARVDRFGIVPEVVSPDLAIQVVAHRWEGRHWRNS